MPKVSICIPTYKRPELLKVALDSCFAQTFKDFEVVIVDDSPDTATEELVAAVSPEQRVNYVRNQRKTSQASAVNQLFGLAEGEFLVLVHDDNFLMPNGIEDLLQPLAQHRHVVAAFGKHYLARNDGSILDAESELLNYQFFKTEGTANSVQRSAWSAMVLQFPGDGYMVRTAAARKTLYRDEPQVGEACDAEFGYRLAELGDFYFVGKYTHAYRVTEESISSTGLPIHLSKQYFLLQNRTVPSDLEDVRRAMLRSLAPVAVNGCLLTADRRKALQILLGPHYPWKKELAKGVIQFGLALAPRAATEIIIEGNARRKNTAPGAWIYTAQRVGED